MAYTSEKKSKRVTSKFSLKTDRNNTQFVNTDKTRHKHVTSTYTPRSEHVSLHYYHNYTSHLLSK